MWQRRITCRTMRRSEGEKSGGGGDSDGGGERRRWRLGPWHGGCRRRRDGGGVQLGACRPRREAQQVIPNPISPTAVRSPEPIVIVTVRSSEEIQAVHQPNFPTSRFDEIHPLLLLLFFFSFSLLSYTNKTKQIHKKKFIL